jgi:hypothetical protein
VKLSLKVWPDPELFGVPPAVKLTGICEGSCVPLPLRWSPEEAQFFLIVSGIS